MGALLGSMAAVCIGLSDLHARRVVAAAGAIATALAISVVAIGASLVAVAALDSTPVGDDLALGAASGLLLGVGLVAYYGGLDRSSATVVSPVVAAVSAVIPFVYAVIDGADPSTGAWVGALVAIVGIVIISVAGGSARHVWVGLAWGLVSGVLYGVGFAMVIETSPDAGAWPATTQRIGASVLLVGVVTGRRNTLLPPVGVRTAAVLGGVFAGVSTVLYVIGLQTDPTAAVITTSMYPAASVAVGHLYFADALTRTQVLGLVLALAGIVGLVTG